MGMTLLGFGVGSVSGGLLAVCEAEWRAIPKYARAGGLGGAVMGVVSSKMIKSKERNDDIISEQDNQTDI